MMCKNIYKRKARGPPAKKIYEGYMVILLEFIDTVYVD
jgi:hypothetical protein